MLSDYHKTVIVKLQHILNVGNCKSDKSARNDDKSGEIVPILIKLIQSPDNISDDDFSLAVDLFNSSLRHCRINGDDMKVVCEGLNKKITIDKDVRNVSVLLCLLKTFPQITPLWLSDANLLTFLLAISAQSICTLEDGNSGHISWIRWLFNVRPRNVVVVDMSTCGREALLSLLAIALPFNQHDNVKKAVSRYDDSHLHRILLLTNAPKYTTLVSFLFYLLVVCDTENKMKVFVEERPRYMSMLVEWLIRQLSNLGPTDKAELYCVLAIVLTLTTSSVFMSHSVPVIVYMYMYMYI